MIEFRSAKHAIIALALVGIGCSKAPSTETSYVEACLSVGVPGEENSELGRALPKFAFALSEADSAPATPLLKERILDRASIEVPALNSEQAWQSAGRYFQAADFHSFEIPACKRAWARRAK